MRLPPTALVLALSSRMRQWFKSRTRGRQPRDPGAIPGRRSSRMLSGIPLVRPRGPSGSSPERARPRSTIPTSLVGLLFSPVFYEHRCGPRGKAGFMSLSATVRSRPQRPRQRGRECTAPGSSSGRTSDFDSLNEGSIPSPGTRHHLGIAQPGRALGLGPRDARSNRAAQTAVRRSVLDRARGPLVGSTPVRDTTKRRARKAQLKETSVQSFTLRTLRKQ